MQLATFCIVFNLGLWTNSVHSYNCINFDNKNYCSNLNLISKLLLCSCERLIYFNMAPVLKSRPANLSPIKSRPRPNGLSLSQAQVINMVLDWEDVYTTPPVQFQQKISIVYAFWPFIYPTTVFWGPGSKSFWKCVSKCKFLKKDALSSPCK